MRFWKLLFLLLVPYIFQTCLVIENKYPSLPPGKWRGVLRLLPREIMSEEVTPDERVGMKFEEVTEGELPFNFEVIYENETNFYIEIINGDERIRVDDITFGTNRATARDTILIEFPLYDSYITGFYEEDVIEGKWVVKTRENYSIPFVARHGEAFRFTDLKKEPVMDITGAWETTFGLDEKDKEDPYKAVGEFQQNGNHLTGTFRTETGDYRYLEGTVQADKVYLSTFDGSHAYLFEAKILPDSTLIGSFRSGTHYLTTWEARLNADFELSNPDSLTYLKEGYDKFTFSFENADGKLISLDDPAYQGKIKIIQIMGTWCPNCLDETEFLVDYLKKNPNENLAVIVLAFEKYEDTEKARQAIKRYQQEMGVDYEILLAGISKKLEAAKSLPMLNAIVSFPTMIYIDENNKVRRIHTGFSGPATSKYKEFTKDFDTFVQSLLQELSISQM